MCCIFICNKICWYAWQSSLPSSSTSHSKRTQLGTNPRSFLSPQSFHPISLIPISYPTPKLPRLQSLGSIMAAVTESIKVVLMRLNDRRWPLLSYTHKTCSMCANTHTFRPHTSRIPLLSSSIESRQLPPYSSSAKLPLKLYRNHLCIGCPESTMFSNEIFRKKV